MWFPIFVSLLLAILGLDFWWRRRFRVTRQALEAAQQRLREESKIHRRALLQERSRQETLFNSMAEGVLILEADGRVDLVNHALVRLFDLPPDVSGRPLLEVFRFHQLEDLFHRAQRDGHVLGFEFSLPGPPSRFLQINAATLPHTPTVLPGVLFIFHDQTRLKELENTRREFVANVSHELRTPLSLIKGYVETLIDGAKDDPQVASRFLGTIDKQTDRLTYLIEDLLTISRLESGQIVLNCQPTRLRPVADRVLDELRLKAREREVRLTNDLPPQLEAWADAPRLQQVFFNLVDNAIKYGRRQGHVRLLAAPAPPRSVEVQVIDDGPGIPPEAIDRVFERFFRVDLARSREQGGTGLGLSIVKHIIQSHGGTVRLSSKVGCGCTCFLTLPAQKPDGSEVERLGEA